MFYSQTLAMPRVENLCAKCDSRFKSWVEYHKHVMTVKCAKTIKPLNVSGRSKTQIVEAVEKTWGTALIL